MIDFSKAFDKVEIRLLLRKLRSFGGSDSFLELLLVLMSGRKQIVSVNGVHSDSASIGSGLPKGIRPLSIIVQGIPKRLAVVRFRVFTLRLC